MIREKLLSIINTMGTNQLIKMLGAVGVDVQSEIGGQIEREQMMQNEANRIGSWNDVRIKSQRPTKPALFTTAQGQLPYTPQGIVHGRLPAYLEVEDQNTSGGPGDLM